MVLHCTPEAQLHKAFGRWPCGRACNVVEKNKLGDVDRRERSCLPSPILPRIDDDKSVFAFPVNQEHHGRIPGRLS